MRFGLLQKYLNTWTDGPGKEKGTRIVSHGLQLRNPHGEPLLCSCRLSALSRTAQMIFMLYKKSCQRMADDLWRAGWCAPPRGANPQTNLHRPGCFA